MGSWAAGEPVGFVAAAVASVVDRGCSEEHGAAAVVVVAEQLIQLLVRGRLPEEWQLRHQ